MVLPNLSARNHKYSGLGTPVASQRNSRRSPIVTGIDSGCFVMAIFSASDRSSMHTLEKDHWERGKRLDIVDEICN